MSLEHDANGNLFSTSCRLRIYAGSLYVFWLVDLPALRCGGNVHPITSLFLSLSSCSLLDLANTTSYGF